MWKLACEERGASGWAGLAADQCFTVTAQRSGGEGRTDAAIPPHAVFPQLLLGKRLRPETVMEQLRYRYEREVNAGERSALKRAIERDDPVARPMVLCVYDIQLTAAAAAAAALPTVSSSVSSSSSASPTARLPVLRRAPAQCRTGTTWV